MADPMMPAEGESFLQELVDSTWEMSKACYRGETLENLVKALPSDVTYRQAKAEKDLRDYIKTLYAAIKEPQAKVRPNYHYLPQQYWTEAEKDEEARRQKGV